MFSDNSVILIKFCSKKSKQLRSLFLLTSPLSHVLRLILFRVPEKVRAHLPPSLPDFSVAAAPGNVAIAHVVDILTTR